MVDKINPENANQESRVPQGALNYSQLRELFPTVQEASEKQETYSNIANHNPQNLEALLRQDAGEIGLNIGAFDEVFREARETQKYEAVTQMVGNVINAKYGAKVGAFNLSLSSNPEQALVGAPENVIRATIENISMPAIEQIQEEFPEYARKHLAIKEKEATYKDLQSSNTDKRIAAQKKIRDEFTRKHNGPGSDDPTVVNAFYKIANALNVDVREYVNSIKTDGEELTRTIIENDEGRAYLGRVGKGIIQKVVTASFTGQLQEEN